MISKNGAEGAAASPATKQKEQKKFKTIESSISIYIIFKLKKCYYFLVKVQSPPIPPFKFSGSVHNGR